MNVLARGIFGAVMICVCGSVTGAELGYALRAGASYSDNVERLGPGLEESAIAAVVGVELDGRREEGRLRYLIDTDISHYEYLSSDIDGENFGHASLRGSYDFVPDTFGWNAAMSLGQIRDDVLRPLAPGNVDEQFMWSTGPTVQARLGGFMHALLDARYTRLDYASRPFDSETLGGRLELQRRPSPRSLVGAGVSIDDVSYLSAGGFSDFDYQRKEAFLRLDLTAVRTSIAAEVGVAQVSGELVDDSNALARLRLSRRMTPMLSGFFSYSREYPTSDLGSQFPTTSSTIPEDSSILTGAPRLAERGQVGIDFNSPRTHGQLSYSRNREESIVDDVAGQRTVDTIRGEMTRNFTPRTLGTLYAEHAREKFSAEDERSRETAFGARLGFSLSRSIGVDVQLEHRNRDGTSAIGEYSELNGGIFIRYEGGARQRTRPD
jgi:hypothetical protein